MRRQAAWLGAMYKAEAEFSSHPPSSQKACLE